MALTDEQHARRRIGSSDAAIACGLPVFGRTRYDLWLELTGRQDRKELGGLRRIRRGNYLEAFAAEEYEHEMGTVLRRDNLTRSPDDKPWMTAHIDRRVTGAHKLVECKAPGPYTRGYGEAGTDEVPDYVLLQVAHQCICMGDDWVGDVAAIMGEDFRVYPIDITPGLRDRVIDLEREFWGYVERDEPPPLQTVDDANKAWPAERPGRIGATDFIVQMCRDLDDVKRKQKRLDSVAEEMKVAIMDYMADADVLVGDGGDVLATWRLPKPSNVTDWKAVTLELFDAYQEVKRTAEMDEYGDVAEDFERRMADLYRQLVDAASRPRKNTRRFLLK